MNKLNGKSFFGPRLLLTGWLLWGWCGSAGGEPLLSQYHHTSWIDRDGAPPAVMALAQTTDGELWLGTAAGLYSFDGYAFKAFHAAIGSDLPSLLVASLASDKDGGLWAGLSYGGIAHVLKDHSVLRYGVKDGVHSGAVSDIVIGKSGDVWAVAGSELVRFQSGRWRSFGPSEGESTNQQHGVDGIALDRNGTLWVKFAETLYRVPPGGSSLQSTRDHSKYAPVLKQAPDGRIWLADPLEGVVRPTCPDGNCGLERRTQIQGATGITFDDFGNCWVSTNRGLFRIHPALLTERGASAGVSRKSAVESMTAAEGLSSNHAEVILRDREGNIWVGTRRGLDRFQRSAFTPLIDVAHERPVSLAADASGTVWMYHDRGLSRIVEGVRQPVADFLEKSPADPRRSSLIASGENGSLLVSTSGGLYRSRAGKKEHIEQLKLLASFPIMSMAEDRRSGLYLTLNRMGVWRLFQHKWLPLFSGPRSPETTPLTLALDRQGRLWTGYPDGAVQIVEEERVRTVIPHGQNGLGTVLVMTQALDHMWIGGTAGVAWFDGQSVHELLLQKDQPRGVSGIVESHDGGLWLNAADGVLRIPPDEIRHALNDPSYPAHFETFDASDGLGGLALQWVARPSAVHDAKGVLWFSTTGGILSIDPAHIQRNPAPPTLQVSGMIVDGRAREASAELSFPSSAHTLEIDYKGVSLAMPERVHYRYRLEGEDRDWQDAGVRRQAIYTGLRPGSYRFRLMAVNGSGIWSDPSTLLAINVQPLWYQTTWFRVVSFFALGLLIWVFYALRVRLMLARLKESLDERARERVRIARDLHDTLLQGIQGLVLRFHVAAEQVPDSEPAHALLNSALSRADQVIAEGRDRVKQLRGQPCSTQDLLKALLHTAESQRWDQHVEIRAVCVGDVQQVRAVVHDELYAIGREAIANALQHASPALIEIEVTSGTHELRLRCRDNGVGMHRTENFQRDGHWGIVGMEERAARIGAIFELWSAPGAGTEIDVRLKGSTAYVPRASRFGRPSLSPFFASTEE